MWKTLHWVAIAASVFGANQLSQAQESYRLLSAVNVPHEQDNGQQNQEKQIVIDLLAKAKGSLTNEQSETVDAINKALAFLAKQRNPSIGPLIRYRMAQDNPLQEYWNVEQVQDFLEAQLEPSPYWLGVQCEPANEFVVELEGNNRVTAKGGLKVNTVTEGSPAQSASLQVGDVIVQFNDHPTNDLGQLVAAISSSEGEPSSVEIVRDRTWQTVQITPKLRKQESTDTQLVTGDQNRFIADFFNTESRKIKIPEGFEYTVTLNRDGVTKIQVAHRNKNVATTPDKISELPAETRPFAKQLLKGTQTLVTNPVNDYYQRLTFDARHWPEDVHRLAVATDSETSQSIKRLEKQMQEVLETLKSLKQD